MTIGLLLRALRKCERLIESDELEAHYLVVGTGAYDYETDDEALDKKTKKLMRLADKLAGRIIETVRNLEHDRETLSRHIRENEL